MNQHKAFLLGVLREQCGGDFHRAKQMFKYCFPEQMKEEYGESGKTRAEILDGYKKHYETFLEAIKWLENLPD